MKKLSIVTVCYNSADCIEKTIQSVIAQKHANTEYIIIDGDSKDNTMDIIRRYDNSIDIIVSEKDAGIYDAMNKSMDLATGDYVLFLNADDVFADLNVLEDISTTVEKSNADVFYGDVIIYYKYGEFLKKPLPLELITRKMVFSHQAVFIKRNVLLDNKFDLNYRYAADYNQLSSLYLKKYNFEYINRVIAKVPVDSGATYHNFRESLNEHYLILEKRGEKAGLKKEKAIILVTIVHFLKSVIPNCLLYPILKWLSKYKTL